MDGMQVLGEAVTQAEFLADHVILQDLAGPKSIRDIVDMQAQLRGIGDLASLQTIQSEHAYPASSHSDRGRAILREAEYFLRSTYPDVVTILMEDSSASSAFLTVSSKYPDSRFLIDQSSLRLNINLADEGELLSCRLLTCNREVVRESDVAPGQMAREVGELVEDMLGERYHCCGGLTLAPTSLLPHLRREDIPHILIEKYDGRLVYRARECGYIVDQETSGPSQESREHCPHCRILSSSLRVRGGTQVTLTEPEERGEKRKRGRPKGGRKVILEDNACDQDEVEKVETYTIMTAEVQVQEENLPPLHENQNVTGTSEAEDDFAMEDDPEDHDFASPVIPKRGRRKKIISKKALELENSKLRPGRKPKVVLPMTCPEEDCRQLLETLDQFREHQRTEHPGSLVCLEEGCLQRLSTAEEMEAHSRRHRGERPFSCGECKREYSTRQDLRLHYRKHTGE